MKALYLRKKLRSPMSHVGATPESLPLLTSPQELPTEQPVPQPEPENLYAKTRREAIGLGEELIQALLRNLTEGDITDLEAIWELLPFYTGVVATAKVAQARRAPPPATATQGRAETAVTEYLVSSLFLAHCHRFLTSNPHGHERLHLVTGITLSPKRRTLDHISKVTLAEQSEVGAVADQISLKQALGEMESFGTALHGLFHSHPREGPLATCPSSTDLDTHERYERGGVPLVGCIFVRDGYLRFFRHSSEPFSISICGTGIVPINEADHVYKIQNRQGPRGVSDDVFAAEDEG